MVHDLLQVEFLALLYFKQKSVFSPLVRQKANPAISCWAAVWEPPLLYYSRDAAFFTLQQNPCSTAFM